MSERGRERGSFAAHSLSDGWARGRWRGRMSGSKKPLQVTTSTHHHRAEKLTLNSHSSVEPAGFVHLVVAQPLTDWLVVALLRTSIRYITHSPVTTRNSRTISHGTPDQLTGSDSLFG